MSDIDNLFGASDDDEEMEQQANDQPLQGTQEDQIFDDTGLEDNIEDTQQAAQQPTRGLFGSDEESDEDREAGSGDEQQGHSMRKKSRKEADEELGAPLDATAPLMPLPPAGSVCMLRTSNIVGIQPSAYDPATFEREEETFVDETGRHRVRLAVNGVIRWRLRRLPDGRSVPESNARIVRWEDGSMQLLLGDEVLDVTQQDIRGNNSYLFVQLPGIFQGLSHMSSRLALRPASLDSGLHRRLREVVDKKNAKVAKVASHGGLQNPELDKARREAAEEERIKGREALQRKQDRAMARAYGGGGRAARPSRLTDKYLEEEQEWEGDAGGDAYEYDDGLTADMRARLSLARNRNLMDGDAEMEAGRRLQAAKRGPATRSGRLGRAPAKRRRAGSDDEEEEEESEEDDDFNEEEEEEEYQSSGNEDDEGEGDEERDAGRGSQKPFAQQPAVVPPPKPSGARQRRGVVLSDDDDE